jgi:hypothetical protein
MPIDLQQLAQVDLIKELGIDKLPRERQEELLAQMGEIVQQRILLRLLEELPEEDKDEFAALLEANQDNPEVVEMFLKEKVPNMDVLAMEEIGKYKSEVMELLDAMMTED